MFRFLVIILFLFVISPFGAQGQEFQCNVEINSEKAQTTDREIFNEMKNTIMEFMNRRWTDDEFRTEERIKCNIFITLMSASASGGQVSCNATAQIQFSRPIYGTSYESILFNFLDKRFDFEYTQGQIMNFNENAFLDNLTSMLGFYAYVMLAMDYDSFSKLGGNRYVETARNIASAAEAADNRGGWGQSEENGRFWLIENLNSQILLPFREGVYTYHRQAMDKFIENPDESRELILEVLEDIRKVNRNKPQSLFQKSFFMAKSAEIINIYSQAPMEMKQKVVPILKELDPLNADKYNRIMRN